MTTTHPTVAELAERVLAIYAEHDEMAGIDAGFDGGEFSGPEHGRMADREVAALLAAHPTIDRDAVEQAVAALLHDACDPEDPDEHVCDESRSTGRCRHVVRS